MHQDGAATAAEPQARLEFVFIKHLSFPNEMLPTIHSGNPLAELGQAAMAGQADQLPDLEFEAVKWLRQHSAGIFVQQDQGHCSYLAAIRAIESELKPDADETMLV